MTDEDGLAWFENVLGAASKNEQGDMQGARCPKCNGADFVKISDLFAESAGRLGENAEARGAARAGGLTDEQIVRKFAPPRQSSAMGAALAVGVPLGAIAFYVYRRFGDNAGQLSILVTLVVTAIVLMTMARKFSDKYYHAQRRWNRLFMCLKCGQVVAS
jgi:hypothetical protein